MLLAKEFVEYTSRQIVKRLSPLLMEVTDATMAAELINSVIVEELEVEDHLNEEVREILSQYSEYMRREAVSYQEMFRKIKNQLIQQRKVVRASGRDSGDGMKLSRDKVTDMSHKLLTAIRKSRDFRLKKDPNDVRLEIVRSMTDVLQTEDRVDRMAQQRVRSHKKDIPEGSEEWGILHKRYYADELKKLGINLNA